MYCLKKVLVLTLIASGLASCVPKPPYEIKSPCVSIDSDNPYAINPCIRRPVNISRDIS